MYAIQFDYRQYNTTIIILLALVNTCYKVLKRNKNYHLAMTSDDI